MYCNSYVTFTTISKKKTVTNNVPYKHILTFTVDVCYCICNYLIFMIIIIEEILITLYLTWIFPPYCYLDTDTSTENYNRMNCSRQPSITYVHMGACTSDGRASRFISCRARAMCTAWHRSTSLRLKNSIAASNCPVCRSIWSSGSSSYFLITLYYMECSDIIIFFLHLMLQAEWNP